ncbi:MAG TPA: flotillin domain-containing protein, partial [Polyangium sp.]|nr:flotillin domain-containing protein [Polyangium sp.]
RAAALKAQAEAEQQQAMQAIITVEETAKANREKAIAVIKSEEDAQRSRIAAEREAFKLKVEAEAQAATLKAHAEGEAAAKRAAAEGEIAKAQGLAQARELEAQAGANVMRLGAEAKAAAAAQEAQALISLAEATKKRGEAEADAKRKIVEAENAVSTKFLLRDVAVKALDVLPSVTRELMTPARAISEIKVLQLQGGPGSSGANGENGGSPLGNVASPVLKTILEAGAAYPLLREMMSFAQVDSNAIADKARSFLNNLPAELRQTLENDPSFAKKLEQLERRSAAEAPPNIEVRDAEPPTIPPGGHAAS